MKNHIYSILASLLYASTSFADQTTELDKIAGSATAYKAEETSYEQHAEYNHYPRENLPYEPGYYGGSYEQPYNGYNGYNQNYNNPYQAQPYGYYGWYNGYPVAPAAPVAQGQHYNATAKAPTQVQTSPVYYSQPPNSVATAQQQPYYYPPQQPYYQPYPYYANNHQAPHNYGH